MAMSLASSSEPSKWSNPPKPPKPVGRPEKVVQYFAQWSIYGRKYRPWHMKLDSITHVQYAFFDVTSDCVCASLDPYADYQARPLLPLIQ